MTESATHAAFAGAALVHRGSLTEVLAAIKLNAHDAPDAQLLIFELTTGQQVDFDLRGALDEVLARLQPKSASRGPGRPKLGVEGREVSLLPRHWEWLARQPNGASAAIRRLVDDASKKVDPALALRAKRDAAYRVMSALAGDLAGFEEASRALFAGDSATFTRHSKAWPRDVRAHLAWMLAAPTA